MERLEKQAVDNRAAVRVVRERGNGARAEELEARADELESGRVTDVTDVVSGLVSWALRR
ncbi:hypothetical protein SZN_34472 [Streptomyces zinciresistens K42]|uniref:Uncharacterized protein n=1 Tax=Streptomyces zinciresistens K42 TaxID=700597 RepID=G2GMY9_9ACTN|nr:hypothetical protein [Streptomyces zinciresistens]EGX55132.1 hypothetical protein SZN_34472 [Streptomyces zinciresistens K42]